MTRVVITGWGVVSPAGVGAVALHDVLAGRRDAATDVSGVYPHIRMPDAYACADFDVRQLLGRKGTSFLDRATALAMVACGLAIVDSELSVDADDAGRIGVCLGTTLGSLASSSDYSRETLVADRPYLVNPVLFPNTVMNCAAGQSAIRFGLKGVNSTVAGGRIGFLAALRYAHNVLRRGYADTMLVGAVEELTPHTAWVHHRLGRLGRPGEAAAVFVLRAAPDEGPPPGVPPLAEVAAVTAGFQPPDRLRPRSGTALAGCVRRALDHAGHALGHVDRWATGEVSDPGAAEVEQDAAVRVFDSSQPGRITVRDRLGDCGAALGALHLAALLSGSPGEVENASTTVAGATGVLAGWSPEGGVAAAVLTGVRDVRSDSR